MDVDVAIDMISSLPDEVLTNILSFLSAKEAVHTCILSKRWRYLWASMPILEFSLDEFWPSDRDNSSEEEWRECEDKFELFVNDFLENRGPSGLDMFYYTWDSYGETSLEWLERVVVLLPRVINVFVLSSELLNVPDSVFSCASLKNLYLSLPRDTIIRPESINLPSLKVLELHSVAVASDFIRKLFLGCPALESLTLDGYDLGISSIPSDILKKFDIRISSITSDILKKLDITHLGRTQQMRISCPSLVSLSIRSFAQVGDISLGNMPSLANVVIRFYAFDGHQWRLDVLNGLSNATTIKLHFACLQMKNLQQLEEFGNGEMGYD